jgi:pimeloyl-ACP methyl ester carboxylesterase
MPPLDRQCPAGVLWRLWSPTWKFNDATFERSAVAFDSPDFVEVVIHSYRHRFGLVAGDAALVEIERRLAEQPPIKVPTISIDGTDNGVRPPAAATQHAGRFKGPRSHRLAHGVGHNVPQEAPQVFTDAVIELVRSG